MTPPGITIPGLLRRLKRLGNSKMARISYRDLITIWDTTTADTPADDLQNDLKALVDKVLDGCNANAIAGVAVGAPTAAGEVPSYNGTSIVWAAPSGGSGISSVTADPGAPADGAVWYRSDLYELRIQANGATWRFTLSPV